MFGNTKPLALRDEQLNVPHCCSVAGKWIQEQRTIQADGEGWLRFVDRVV